MKWLLLSPLLFCQLYGLTPCCDGQFFVEAAPLYGTAYLNNQDFAGSIQTTMNQNPTSIDSVVDIKKLNCHWQVGVRGALGYAPCCDDTLFFKLEGTYLPNKHSQTFCKKPEFTSSLLSYLIPLWDQALVGNVVEQVNTNWKLNFATLDLLAATKLCTASKVSLFPYIGLRGLWLKKEFTVNYKNSLYISDNIPLTQASSKITLSDLNRALGITGGTSFDAPLFCNLHLFGKVGASILVGRLKVTENGYGGTVSQASGDLSSLAPSFQVIPLSLGLVEKNTAWTTNLETELGFSYKLSLFKSTLSVSYFNSYWFDQNHLKSVVFSTNPVANTTEVNYSTLLPTPGALGIQGVAFQLGVAF